MVSELHRDLFGERAVEPALLIDERQLLQLEFGIGGKMALLELDIGLFGIALRTDRHIFARRHRHRARDQSRGPGNENRRRARPRRRDARDQARGRDNPVVRTEDRGAQPADPGDGVIFAVHRFPLMWRCSILQL